MKLRRFVHTTCTANILRVIRTSFDDGKSRNEKLTARFRRYRTAVDILSRPDERARVQRALNRDNLAERIETIWQRASRYDVTVKMTSLLMINRMTSEVPEPIVSDRIVVSRSMTTS